MKRKLKVHFLIIAISLTSLLGGYIQSLSVPIYAADDWETLTSNEQLVDAFKVYCKSRNTVIDGSVLDAVTSFTTTTFNNICNTLGIDMTLLQAEIQRMYSGTGYKYAFTASGLSGFNRIFAEFLQNNDLSVGDTVNDEELFNGEYFHYGEYNCLIWVFSSSPTGLRGYPDPRIRIRGNILTDGVYFKNLYDSNIRTFNYPFSSQTLRISFSNNLYRLNDNALYGSVGGRDKTFNSGTIIFKNLADNKYYLSTHYEYYYYGNNDHYEENIALYSITGNDSTVQDCNIYVTTNNQIINNETVINEGDTIIYNNDGTPDNGGSGGDDNPDQGDDWDPSIPTIPPAGGGTGNNNTINWPDIDIPDFNLPDFSLGDITDKFPFSIPFDLVALLTVLDGEPIAPHIQGSIPLGDFYTWDLDFDFSQFDNFARIFRAFEFIGFCIGLIYFTVRIVKG